MLNEVIVQGRLCAAPELKTSPSGTPVVKIRLGITRNYKNAEGNYDSDFVSVVAWRGTAELISKHFGKGDMIIVRGSIQTGSYTNSDGVKVYTTDIVADSVYFAGGSKQKHSDSGYYPDEPPAPVSQPAPASPPSPANSVADERQSFANAPADDYPF